METYGWVRHAGRRRDSGNVLHGGRGRDDAARRRRAAVGVVAVVLGLLLLVDDLALLDLLLV